MVWMLSGCFLASLVFPNASTLFVLQDGYWELTPELGTLLNFNAELFANVFLKSKGIDSLGENLLEPFQSFCADSAGSLIRPRGVSSAPPPRAVRPAGSRARADILRLVATLLVLQLMRVEKLEEGTLLRTLFSLVGSPQHRSE